MRRTPSTRRPTTTSVSERYDKAEPILTKCFEERPKTDGLGYYIGFMRYRKKDYSGALDAFKVETSPNPAIQQLTHFYSGLALAVMGLPERATAELDAATRGQVGSAIAGPAERLRDSIAAGGGQGSRFHAEVRVGGTYDTNVKVLPNPSNDPLANAIRFLDTKSTGELYSVTLSYDWLRYGNWESTIGYQFFESYPNSFPDFAVQDQVVTLGATYRGAFESGVLAGSRYLVGGQYAFDNQLLGENQFLQRNTGTLFATLQLNAGGDSFWNPTNVFSPIFRVQGKLFNNFTGIPLPPSDNRNATNYMTGISHTFYWSGDRHWFRVGFQYDTDVANGRNWSYTPTRSFRSRIPAASSVRTSSRCTSSPWCSRCRSSAASRGDRRSGPCRSASSTSSVSPAPTSRSMPTSGTCCRCRSPIRTRKQGKRPPRRVPAAVV